MGRKIITLKRKSPAPVAPSPTTKASPRARLPRACRGGAKRSQTPPSAPAQCPQKSQNVPNPSLHSPAANQTHRPLLSKSKVALQRERSKSKEPNPPTRPKPRQTTPSIDPCKSNPPAKSAGAPLHFRGRLYIYPNPCYTPPNNCQSLRLSLPEDPPSRTRSIKPSCRTQVAAQSQVVFRCFVGCNYSPLHLRKSVSNGF